MSKIIASNSNGDEAACCRLRLWIWWAEGKRRVKNVEKFREPRSASELKSFLQKHVSQISQNCWGGSLTRMNCRYWWLWTLIREAIINSTTPIPIWSWSRSRCCLRAAFDSCHRILQTQSRIWNQNWSWSRLTVVACVVWKCSRQPRSHLPVVLTLDELDGLCGRCCRTLWCGCSFAKKLFSVLRDTFKESFERFWMDVSRGSEMKH